MKSRKRKLESLPQTNIMELGIGTKTLAKTKKENLEKVQSKSSMINFKDFHSLKKCVEQEKTSQVLSVTRLSLIPKLLGIMLLKLLKLDL